MKNKENTLTANRPATMKRMMKPLKNYAANMFQPLNEEALEEGSQ